MASVVTSRCFGCKYTDCVVICPVECFFEGEQMVFIDPDMCTSCGACNAECPVEAIYEEDEVPESEKDFIALNREMVTKCPPIFAKKEPLAAG